MNHDHHAHQGDECHDQPAGNKKIKESQGEDQAKTPDQHAKPFLQQWCDLSLDRKIESCIGFVGLAFAGILAWTAWCQLDAMKDQLAEIKSGSEDTKTIAESAKAQAESTKVMAESMLRDQRAWVGPHGVSNPQVKPGMPVGLDIHYTDGGRSPAKNFRVITALRYQPSNEKLIPEYRTIKTSQAMVAMYPHMAVSADISEIRLVLDQSQIDQLRSESHRLFVFGKYSYSTINVDGGGTFCMFFHRDLTQAPGWCDSYNEAY